MQYRRLGSSGLQLSALSLGSWLTFGKQIDDAAAEALMHLAYDRGVNFFDNAEAYAEGRSELVMGEILRRAGWPRDTFVVSSKVYWGGQRPTQLGLSRKHVTEACHAALRRLQLDHLDLYFCHRPDPNTPIEETVWAMHNLIVQGKVLYWGTSEWSAAAIEEAHAVARREHLIPPSVEQPQYNLLTRERVEVEYAPLFRAKGMGATIWSPLASGVLSGKYGADRTGPSRLDLPGLEWLRVASLDPRNLAVAAALAEIAAQLGTTPARLAIAWTIKNPDVTTAILGARDTGQLAENLDALAALPLLTPDVMAALDAATRPDGAASNPSSV